MALLVTKTQLAKIHIAKKALGLTEEQYRDILWCQCHVRSAASLTQAQAQDLLRHFQRLGWHPTRRTHPPRFDDLGYRLHMATPAQLRKIEALWMAVARTKTEAALRLFLHRRFGLDDLRFVRRDQVTPILTALQAMQGRTKETACVG
jgi:phage gp16-like protein